MELAFSHCIPELLHLILVDSALFRVHQVELHALFEDGFGDLEALEQISLDQSGRQLLPVGTLHDKLLVELFVASLNGSAALYLKIGESDLSLLCSVFYDDLHGFEEVSEGHSTVLLVFGLSKPPSVGQNLVDDGI